MPAGFSAAHGDQQGPDNQMELRQGLLGHNSCHILGHSGPSDNESGADNGNKRP